MPAQCKDGEWNKRTLTFQLRLIFPVAKKECCFVCLMAMEERQSANIARKISNEYLWNNLSLRKITFLKHSKRRFLSLMNLLVNKSMEIRKDVHQSLCFLMISTFGVQMPVIVELCYLEQMKWSH